MTVDFKPKSRLGREARTLRAMVNIYCRHHHKTKELCESCQGLLNYAHDRLWQCRFGEQKPQCARCPIHCYKKNMRESVKAVMRYAGPRMLTRHPILAIMHMVDKYWYKPVDYEERL